MAWIDHYTLCTQILQLFCEVNLPLKALIGTWWNMLLIVIFLLLLEKSDIPFFGWDQTGAEGFYIRSL